MSRRRRGRRIDGWIVLDKPVGMTSTEAVARVKRAFEAEKAGHAGTLDPLASGSLPIALGEATKTVAYVMDGRKTYRFAVRWGAETATDDREGQVTATSDVRPSPEAIRAALPEFTGTILQTPPAFSAIKIAGERAYDLARAGETVDIAPREIVIDRLELLASPDADTAVFLAECGKGTYVRSLARDLGRRLGTRAHVAHLRRLAVGPFGEGDLVPIEAIEAEDGRGRALLPTERALAGLPRLDFDEGAAARLRRGQSVILRGRDAPLPGPAYVMARDGLVAIGEVEQGALHPRRIFGPAPPRPVRPPAEA